MKQGLLIVAVLFSLNINSRAQGLMPSTVRDIYDFAVGDTFEYYRDEGYNYLGATFYSHLINIVISKRYSQSNDTVFYNYSELIRIEAHTGQNITITTNSYSYSINYTDLDSLIFPMPANCPSLCDSTECANICYAYDSVYIDSVWLNHKKVSHRGITPGLSLLEDKYADGLGHVYSIIGHDDPWWDEKELIYYHKANGEQWGTPYYFTIVGIEEKQTLHATIFPNPATEQIAISIPPDALAKYNHEPLLFQLFDITGRAVQTQNITTEKTLFATAHLPQGIYYWRMASAGNMLQQGKIARQ